MVPDPAATAPWPLTQLSALPDVALAPVEKFLMFRFGARQECHPAKPRGCGESGQRRRPDRENSRNKTLLLVTHCYLRGLRRAAFANTASLCPPIEARPILGMNGDDDFRNERSLASSSTFACPAGRWLEPRPSFITLKYWVVAGATVHLTTITWRCPWSPILAVLAAPHAGMVIFRATFARLSRPMSMAKR